MPLPLLLGLAAALTAAGAIKHSDASEMFDQVDHIARNAEDRHSRALEKLRSKNSETEEVMARLGVFKLEIQGKSIKRFVSLIEQLRQIQFENRILGEASLDKFFTPQLIKQMEKVSFTAAEAIGVGITSLGTGSLAALGVNGLVASFGTASTGTAIASLTGVAAQNATLASIGGGALAVGGGGLLVGSLVLGGIALGPALLISGFSRASKAEEALTAAKKYRANVDVAVEKIDVGIVALDAIQARVEEVYSVLFALDLRFQHLLNELERIIEEKKSQPPKKSLITSLLQRLGLKSKKISFKDLTLEEKALVHVTYHFAKALIDILEVKILDQDNGVVTQDSEKNVSLANELLGKSG